MQQQEIVVRSKFGLHARVAARITLIAQKFHSNIVLRANGKRANARSLVAVMILAAGMGTRVYIETSGPDEVEALTAVARLIDDRFGENTSL
jgi:phosphocarrier protein HPr